MSITFNDDLSVCNAFEVSEEDVCLVLRNNALHVANSKGLPFEVMAEQIVANFSFDDHTRVALAALDGGCELDEQTKAAQAEIRKILLEQGILSK
ncbi:TPA: hypothetical protein NIB67_006778 [Pseudomonas aeruginosa]|nr:hypothetical protein [Pseudomonas aeruginosa]